MVERLSAAMRRTWREQTRIGFLLDEPGRTPETRKAFDPSTGVEFRFRWLPHRRLRSNTAELERRGILDPDRDESRLFRDGREPSGAHCFLCPENVVISHPQETLVKIDAGGRRWSAGTNFAWLGADHFTVMSDIHEDQLYSRSVLEAMCDVHQQTDGEFRIVFNGHGAGATIPWHLHFQVTTDPMPVESLERGAGSDYPVPLARFPIDEAAGADRYVVDWMKQDPGHHRVNLLVAAPSGCGEVFVVLRDTRRSSAGGKGLMGGWEVSGDFPFSDPAHRIVFDNADLEYARAALAEIRPPGAPADSPILG